MTLKPEKSYKFVSSNKPTRTNSNYYSCFLKQNLKSKSTNYYLVKNLYELFAFVKSKVYLGEACRPEEFDRLSGPCKSLLKLILQKVLFCKRIRVKLDFQEFQRLLLRSPNFSKEQQRKYIYRRFLKAQRTKLASFSKVNSLTAKHLEYANVAACKNKAFFFKLFYCLASHSSDGIDSVMNFVCRLDETRLKGSRNWRNSKCKPVNSFSADFRKLVVQDQVCQQEFLTYLCSAREEPSAEYKKALARKLKSKFEAWKALLWSSKRSFRLFRQNLGAKLKQNGSLTRWRFADIKSAAAFCLSELEQSAASLGICLESEKTPVIK